MYVVKTKCQMQPIYHYSRRLNLLIFSKFGQSLTNHADPAAPNPRSFGAPVAGGVGGKGFLITLRFQRSWLQPIQELQASLKVRKIILLLSPNQVSSH